MTEDVRPICIFCHARFTKAGLGIDAIVPCPDPRTRWGHVEFWRSTKEQRDARFPETPPPAPQDDYAKAKAELDARFARGRAEAAPPPPAADPPPPQGSLF